MLHWYDFFTMARGLRFVHCRLFTPVENASYRFRFVECANGSRRACIHIQASCERLTENVCAVCDVMEIVCV